MIYGYYQLGRPSSSLNEALIQNESPAQRKLDPDSPVTNHDLFQNSRKRGINNTVQEFNSCTSQLDVCQCLVVQTPMDNMSNNKPSISITNVACESKLRSVVMSSMLPYPGNWGAIGRAAHVFSAGIRCRHCIPFL